MSVLKPALVQNVPLKTDKPISLYVKREDLIHPFVSGNKYRKLKYNLKEAELQGHHTLLTFGGAYSNHIAATAYAGQLYNLQTIGVIRGEELEDRIEANPTLKFARSCGMRLKFVSRNRYRQKTETAFLTHLKSELGAFYLIPEGGTNTLAIKGCEEILQDNDGKFDFICCCVGTGGTISGLINTSLEHQKVLGFPALKGDFLKQDIRKFATKNNWDLMGNYHFGGYGKIKPELIAFINRFKNTYDIPLDPIYTGKMMFGIFDLIAKDFFPNESRILAIHTGGLQGIDGMNLKLKQKGWPLIE